MPKPREQTNETQEALIRLNVTRMQDTERAIQVIQNAGGRILHVFPPRAIIAAIPTEKKRELLGQAGIQAVDTDLIGDATLGNASDEERAAVAAWNAHVRGRDSSSTKSPSAGLPWDAPGHLPPDPPPDIQEMLRRRERGL